MCSRTVTSADWQQAAELIADASTAESMHAMVELVIQRAHALFEADMVICDRFDEQARQIAFQMFPEPSPEFIAKTHAPFLAFWHQHPFQPDWVKEIPSGRVAFLSDRIAHRQFRETDLWNDVYVHLRAKNQLMLGGEIEPNRYFCLSCNRLSRDYDTRDRELGGFLQLHLTKLLRLQARRDRAAQSLEVLRNAAAAFVVVDASGEVLELSDRAREILGFAGENGLKRQVLAELARPMGKRIYAGTITKHAIENIEAYALHPSEAGPAFVILGTRFHAAPALRHKLTPREAEILHWIGESKNNAEIAVLLGISPRTVEKHCERVFEKLGVEHRLAAAILARHAGH